MAKRLRTELGIEVELVNGRYGEFKVFVDEQTVVDAGPAALLGILPSGPKVVEAVRAGLEGPANQPSPPGSL